MKNLRYQPMLIRSVILCVVLMTSCSQQPPFDVQGHRGARGLFPENSLPAFEKAIDLGVTTLELDIAITKDNKVVVSHEPFMSRTICLTPNGEAITETEDMAFNLYKMTHDEIKQFDCGTTFHPSYPNQEKVKVYKPLLNEVFDLVASKNADVFFNIEIKSKPSYYGTYTPHPEAYVAIVLDEIKRSGFESKVNLQSFDLTILEYIKKQSPNMPVALLIDEYEAIETKLASLSYKPEIISPYFKLLNKEVVDDLKEKHFKIIPWTINSTADMQQIMQLDIDGIITDYPDRLLTLLNQKP